MGDLAFVVLEEKRPRAVKHSELARSEARRVLAQGAAGSSRLDTDEPDFLVVDEGGEKPDGVGAAADTGHRRVG